jgi:RNA polymerase sigma-70 factor (ECF subfamily)
MLQPDSAEDNDLVTWTLAGRRDAFAALVRRYQRPIFGVVYRLTGDRAVAQELAQETFLRAYQSLFSFDLARPFAPWLYRIATNLGLNWLKRKRVPTVSLDQESPAPRVQVPDATPGPEAQLLQAEFRARLWQELAALPPEFRAVIELRHGEQLSYQEIAERLNVPLSSVKVRLFRARQRLRKRLENEDDV